MKKILSFLLILIMISSCLALSSCGWKSGKSDDQGLTYYLNEDKKSYAVTSGNNFPKDKDVVIPETFNGKPVTVIISIPTSSISSISIPDTIELIGDYVFDRVDENLTYYTEDNGETLYLGNENNHYVILVKSSCKNCRVEEGTRVISPNAFDSSVLDLEIPESVVYISPKAFSNITKQKLIDDQNENGRWDEGEDYDDRNGNGIFNYGEEYYYGIKSIRYAGTNISKNEAGITGNNYYKIQNNTIYSADMTKVIFSAQDALPILPDTVKAVEEYAFINTSFSSEAASLLLNEENGSLYLPSESNPYFMLIESSEDAKISDQTAIIYSYAFKNATSVNTVDIPDSVIQIMKNAFPPYIKNITAININTNNWYSAEDWCNGRAWDLCHHAHNYKADNNNNFYPKSTQIEYIIQDLSDTSTAASKLKNSNDDYRRYIE